jgi:hypothetical protein
MVCNATPHSLQSSRGQFVPFSGNAATIRGEVDFQATDTPAVGVLGFLSEVIAQLVIQFFVHLALGRAE